jgi:hypothetical protein
MRLFLSPHPQNSVIPRIYRAKWTEDIHQEWMRNLREKYPDLGIEKIQRIRGLIDAAVPDCLFVLLLRDPNDYVLGRTRPWAVCWPKIRILA